MAKVKITGHASGSGVFTITAPNSNTDRTITLPDASVTLGTDATKLPLSGGTMTGSINIIDGAESSPAIRFADDTNTGIWSPAADTIAISAGGTERMRMLSDGTLCIGETSAGLSLDTQLFVRQNDANGYAATFLNDGNDANRWGIAIACGSDSPSTTDNYPIRFLDGDGTEVGKVTFDNSGTSYHGQNTAKAWVHFNGSSTVAIRDSHNVSSITDLGTGQYLVNFSNNLANGNFSAVANAELAVSIENAYTSANGSDFTTSRFKILHYENNGTQDSAYIQGIAFGD